jgi:hypothetical protein
LALTLACLSFDFIGTTLDEASEEMGTIQVGARDGHDTGGEGQGMGVIQVGGG